MASHPPRFVPTLTEVVSTAAGEHGSGVPAVVVSHQQLVQRVMQRLDLNLERRLREVIATIVLEQTRTLGPLLRDEIEEVVRESVVQAVAEELSTQRPDS